jgi:polysaccharide export outer membrane protein
VTFQAAGNVTLLDAISQAGGLAENVGGEVVVSRVQTGPDGKPAPSVQHILIRELFDEANPALNLSLHGGEEIRVSQAGRVYVVGDVKHPGAFVITDGYESSVMKALALSDGLDRFSTPIAYVYRQTGAGEARTEIPIELKKILHRKAPDVALMANDILYVPEAGGKKAVAGTLDKVLGLSSVLAGTLIYAAQ